MRRTVRLLLSFIIIFVLAACGSSATNLHALCSESAEWADGKRFEDGTSTESVEDWIGEIGR